MKGELCCREGCNDKYTTCNREKIHEIRSLDKHKWEELLCHHSDITLKPIVMDIVSLPFVESFESMIFKLVS